MAPSPRWVSLAWLLALCACSDPSPAVSAHPPGERPLTLLLIGDTMLGRLVNDVLKSRPPAYPWGDTLPVFASADVRVANLECVISDRGRPWTETPKVFHFRSDAKNIRVLEEASIDLLSLANNHTLDFGYDALLDMLEILRRAGIRHSGAGRNRQEACRVAVLEAHGTRIGFLAFTDNEPVWEARPDKPGTCYAPIDLNDSRARRILDVVPDACPRVDVLIVSIHWGGNWGYEPPAEHRRFARALIDAGADIIFGHSAHVFRGIEIYRGRPVLYSAGDFVDDYMVDPYQRNDQSFIFTVRFAGGAPAEMRLYPTEIRNFQARLARGRQAERIAAKMQALCGELGTTALWHAEGRCLRIPLATR